MLDYHFIWASSCLLPFQSFFFFNDTATTEIYTLSLHDALPISLNLLCSSDMDDKLLSCGFIDFPRTLGPGVVHFGDWHAGDRKSTRLNSSHLVISYAVFCLKKKKQHIGVVGSHYTTSIKVHRVL